LNAIDEFFADRKLPFSASACSHDGGEKRWRSTTARESSSSPAGLEDEDLEQAEAYVDPRPTKVVGTATELRGTTPQKGRHTDTERTADTIGTSTTPPAGFLSCDIIVRGICVLYYQGAKGHNI
jgi:hypothetical protein